MTSVEFGVRRIGLPVEQLPDEALLAGLGSGDDEIAVAFIRRFQAKVYGVALAVSGDAASAQDVAQQAFERAWRNASSYDPRRGSVGTWLATITRNLAIDASRVRRPQPVDTDELLVRMGGRPSDVEEATLAGEQANQLRQALGRLPAEQARAVVLAGLAGLSAREVAESEGIPLGTAKTRIRTGLHHLRRQLIPDSNEYD
jgi:RNA polymerase sigma factor (sigma-70 family)